MIYKEWFSLSPEKIPTNMPLSERIEDYLHPGDKVLDLGCGDGRLYEFFVSKGCSYYGIDVNKAAIEAAKKKYPEESGRFHVASAEDTGFLSVSFDILIAQGTLACMNLEGRTRTMAEMRRIAKDGAILQVTEFDLLDNEPYYQFQRRRTKEHGTVVERPDGSTVGYTTHHFSREELLGLFSRDWEILLEEHPLLTTRNGNQYPSHRIMARKKECSRD